MKNTVFDSLMKALANYTSVNNLTKTADHLYMVEFNQTVVCFKFIQDSGNFLLFADLGKIPSNDQEAFFKMLLEANHALFATAGATLAVCSALNMVSLQYLGRSESLDEQQFLNIVENFVSAAEFWRQKCTSHCQAHDATSDRKESHDFDSNLMLPV